MIETRERFSLGCTARVTGRPCPSQDHGGCSHTSVREPRSVGCLSCLSALHTLSVGEVLSPTREGDHALITLVGIDGSKFTQRWMRTALKISHRARRTMWRHPDRRMQEVEKSQAIEVILGAATSVLTHERHDVASLLKLVSCCGLPRRTPAPDVDIYTTAYTEV